MDRALLPVPVVHNYGHGGSGITVGWGCAADAAALVTCLDSTPAVGRGRRQGDSPRKDACEMASWS